MKDGFSITRKPVISSNISEIGYNEEHKILEVKFTNGRVYRYSPITLDGYNALLSADSVGSYFYKNIRNNPTVTTEEQ